MYYYNDALNAYKYTLKGVKMAKKGFIDVSVKNKSSNSLHHLLHSVSSQYSLSIPSFLLDFR